MQQHTQSVKTTQASTNYHCTMVFTMPNTPFEWAKVWRLATFSYIHTNSYILKVKKVRETLKKRASRTLWCVCASGVFGGDFENFLNLLGFFKPKNRLKREKRLSTFPEI